jgi:hypothetical protein
MGGTFSSLNNNCSKYKEKISKLNKEINDYKSGNYLMPNANDPYSIYTGGNKKKKSVINKRKKRKNTRKS